MYCVYGNSGWYIHGDPLFGGEPLLGGSVIGGSTVLYSSYSCSAVNTESLSVLNTGSANTNLA